MQHPGAVFYLLTSGFLSLLCACGGGSSENVAASPLPPPSPAPLNIGVQQVFSQLAFDLPVALLQAPGDNSRWYAVEKRGVVRVFDNDSNVSASSMFADIRSRVDSERNEAGLLGMAFHPNFSINDQIYLSYTRTRSPLESVISRFTLNPETDNLDETSEFEIFTVPQEFSNHNGGNVVFGPDGYLYIGFGDGGSSGDPNEHAQNTSHILGSIVRLDVDVVPPARYGIPAMNPFSINTNCMDGVGVSPCPEIFAWGFRNPWRFNFDSQTGALWVGDVGQASWEEIDRVEPGMNYGWDDREGAHCFEPETDCDTDNIDPITEYDHGAGTAVTGGFVYRGAAIPALRGYYVFGDFGSGRIWGVPADSMQGAVAEELIETTLSISSFAQDMDGELYALDYGSGEIYQIIDAL
jgi:glucose/arabinose dehydrogenase